MALFEWIFLAGFIKILSLSFWFYCFLPLFIILFLSHFTITYRKYGYGLCSLYKSMHKICIKIYPGIISHWSPNFFFFFFFFFFTNTVRPQKFTSGLTLSMIGWGPIGENLRHGIETSCDLSSSLSRRRLCALEN